MSFDLADFKYCKEVGLNPFGTGQCLSTDTDLAYWNMRDVSIPLEQGNVFRLIKRSKNVKSNVSIPLEQGNVFRLQWSVRVLCGKASQSHFPTFSDV